MSKLLTALTNKGYSKEEAEEIITNMREDVLAGADPEEILFEEGLEPDYVFDIITF
jgi:hypothetical protein